MLSRNGRVTIASSPQAYHVHHLDTRVGTKRTGKGVALLTNRCILTRLTYVLDHGLMVDSCEIQASHANVLIVFRHPISTWSAWSPRLERRREFQPPFRRSEAVVVNMFNPVVQLDHRPLTPLWSLECSTDLDNHQGSVPAMSKSHGVRSWNQSTIH